MAVILVNRHNFEEEVMESDIPVIVYFWDKNSRPCRLLNPIYDELSFERKYIDKAKFVKINGEENKPISTKFEVEELPSILVFKNQIEIGRIKGFEPKSLVEQRLNNILGF